MNFVLLLPDVPGTLVMLRREIGKSLPLDSSRSPTTPHPHVRNRRLDKCHQTHASDTRRMPKKLPKLGSIAREVIFRFSGSRLRKCSRSTEHRDDGVSQTFLETLIVATIGPCITICSSAAHRLDDYS